MNMNQVGHVLDRFASFGRVKERTFPRGIENLTPILPDELPPEIAVRTGIISKPLINDAVAIYILCQGWTGLFVSLSPCPGFRLGEFKTSL